MTESAPAHSLGDVSEWIEIALWAVYAGGAALVLLAILASGSATYKRAVIAIFAVLFVIFMEIVIDSWARG